MVLEKSSISFVAALTTSYKNWTCTLRTFVIVNDIATWEVACSYREKSVFRKVSMVSQHAVRDGLSCDLANAVWSERDSGSCVKGCACMYSLTTSMFMSCMYYQRCTLGETQTKKGCNQTCRCTRSSGRSFGKQMVTKIIKYIECLPSHLEAHRALCCHLLWHF